MSFENKQGEYIDDHKKSYDSCLKVQVVLEALKNQRTIAQIDIEYGVHPNMVTQWLYSKYWFNGMDFNQMKMVLSICQSQNSVYKLAPKVNKAIHRLKMQ